jgi:DNA-binding PadR family transcriptional regulator
MPNPKPDEKTRQALLNRWKLDKEDIESGGKGVFSRKSQRVYWILDKLSKADALTISEIASGSDTSYSNISAALRRQLLYGYVHVERTNNITQPILYSITKRGEQRLKYLEDKFEA